MSLKQSLLLFVCVLMVLDIITGLVNAIMHNEFKSYKMREGLYHKAGNMLVIGLGILVDIEQGYFDLGLPVDITIAICQYIAFMEIGQILENVCKINPDLAPDVIKNFFSKNK